MKNIDEDYKTKNVRNRQRRRTSKAEGSEKSEKNAKDDFRARKRYANIQPRISNETERIKTGMSEKRKANGMNMQQIKLAFLKLEKRMKKQKKF